MNKNNKIIVSIVLVIAVIIFVYLIIYFNHQNKLSACMEKCFYTPAKENPTNDSGGLLGRLPKDTGDYWQYETRNFETQKQCLDYCLTK